MTITFDTIPSTLRDPGVYTETSDKRAASNSPDLPKRMYVVGHRLSTGEVAAGTPFRATSDAEAERCAGVGSQLAEMIRVVKYANRYVEVWGIGLADAGGGVAASGSLAFTGPATAAGTLNLYVAPYWVGNTLRGVYRIAVTSGMTATQLGDAVVAALAADPYRNVTGVNTTGTVALTARNAGLNGNDLIVSLNLGTGERTPTGIACTITAMASGATNPTLSTALTALGDTHVTHLVEPWTDSTSLTSLETELTSRWSGTVQREMYAFTAVRGSVGTMVTLGTARNSPFETIIGTGLSPTPPCMVAAELAAVDAGMEHPGEPLRGKPLHCMVAPAQGAEPNSSDRNALLADGISTFTVDQAAKCAVGRVISTYQTDANGNASTTYLDRQVAGVLFAVRYDWRTYAGAKYANYMHAADGTKYAPGLKIVTPTTMKNEFAMRARTVWAEGEGWIEDPDQFLADILIERTDDGMDMVGVPNLINRLHVIRTRFEFLR